MNRIIFSIFILLGFSTGLFAQNDSILLTIGDQKISKDEFEYIYKKNNSNLYSEDDKKTPEEYLDLFVNFKLKVLEAEMLKMDTAKTFVKELAKYRKDIAAPYLTDVQYNEQQVKDIYWRLEHEVHASHILLKYNNIDGAKKEKEILEKIKSIRQEIIDGKPFENAAVEYSEDQSVKINKGDLGYFSAFIMVTPFEDAAFNTPVGEISEPVKTDYGYHLIKINDIRKNKGEIHVAHIMKSLSRKATAADKQKAQTAIDSIYGLLLDGADFAEMAKKESQDRKSALNGGVMPWFTAGRIVKSFSDAAFALENDGDISKPVETPYGFHIIKRLKTRPIPSYEKAKPNIENRIKKDATRRKSQKKAFVGKLKEKYDFSENKEAILKLKGKSTKDSAALASATLFTIDNKKYDTDQLKKYTAEKRIKYGDYFGVYDRWVDDEIVKLEDSKLEEKYPEFRFLVNEYHDGILLFNISQEKIWKYAEKDSAGLQKFYEKDKKKHMWDERFKGSIITCKNTKIREEADKLFEAGLEPAEVEEQINTKNELISIETGAWEESQNAIVDYYVWNGKHPDNFDSSTTFVRGDKIAPTEKTLEEARGLYTSDYQDYLEKKWLKKLHSKYKIKVNKKLLKTIKDE